MASWMEFTQVAPRIAEVFVRRHAATGNLCMLGTLRLDGSARISPMEPRILDGQLWLAGMPATEKFRDLVRDPRFTLHTATIDTHVGDGDAKVWGTVTDVPDIALHQRYTKDLFEQSGIDMRGQLLEHLFQANLSGASAVEVAGGHLDITVWRSGMGERVVRKH